MPSNIVRGAHQFDRQNSKIRRPLKRYLQPSLRRPFRSSLSACRLEQQAVPRCSFVRSHVTSTKMPAVRPRTDAYAGVRQIARRVQETRDAVCPPTSRPIIALIESSPSIQRIGSPLGRERTCGPKLITCGRRSPPTSKLRTTCRAPRLWSFPLALLMQGCIAQTPYIESTPAYVRELSRWSCS